MSWSLKLIPAYSRPNAPQSSTRYHDQTSLLPKVSKKFLIGSKNMWQTWTFELITPVDGRFRSCKLHDWIHNKKCQLVVLCSGLKWLPFEILVCKSCLSTSKIQVSKQCIFLTVALEGVRTRSYNLHHRTQRFKIQNVDVCLDCHQASIKILILFSRLSTIRYQHRPPSIFGWSLNYTTRASPVESPCLRH